MGQNKRRGGEGGGGELPGDVKRRKGEVVAVEESAGGAEDVRDGAEIEVPEVSALQEDEEGGDSDGDSEDSECSQDDDDDEGEATEGEGAESESESESELELVLAEDGRVAFPALAHLDIESIRTFPDLIPGLPGGIGSDGDGSGCGCGDPKHRDDKKKALLAQLVSDCRDVFTARAAAFTEEKSTGRETFWLAADVTPKCALERLARRIFDLHTAKAAVAATAEAAADIPTSGDGGDDSGDGIGDVASSLHAFQPFDPSRSGAEWWTQMTDAEDEIGLHWEKDYGLEDADLNVHPHVATVTYLCGGGAPTLVVRKHTPVFLSQSVEGPLGAPPSETDREGPPQLPPGWGYSSEDGGEEAGCGSGEGGGCGASCGGGGGNACGSTEGKGCGGTEEKRCGGNTGKGCGGSGGMGCGSGEEKGCGCTEENGRGGTEEKGCRDTEEKVCGGTDGNVCGGGEHKGCGHTKGAGCGSGCGGTEGKRCGGGPETLQEDTAGKNREDVGGGEANVFLSWPAPGKHIAFDGRWLHGAPTVLAAPTNDDDHGDGVVDASTTPTTQKQRQTPKQPRITFLVNVWLNHVPSTASPLPDDVAAALSSEPLAGESLAAPAVQEGGVEQLTVSSSSDNDIGDGGVGGEQGRNGDGGGRGDRGVIGVMEVERLMWTFKHGGGKHALEITVPKRWAHGDGLGGGRSVALTGCDGGVSKVAKKKRARKMATSKTRKDRI